MDFKEVTAGTPKLLKNYLDLFADEHKLTDEHKSADDDLTLGQDTRSHTPKKHTEPFSSSVPHSVLSSQKYSHHPDIQFFRRIKNKHHFTYHRAKRQMQSIDKVQSRSTRFDPYNRYDLLDRLASFTALNWSIPYTPPPSSEQSRSVDDLNELTCARNGWKCVSISINNNVKNHLICTGCNEQLILKFNTLDQTMGGPFDFDLEDYHDLNHSLKVQYLDQVVKLAHAANCAWINFETPAEGVYYLRPHLKSTNEILINDYLNNLVNLIENNQVLQDQHHFIQTALPKSQITFESAHLVDFIRISNLWVLNRFFSDNKENFSSLLEHIPSWFYSFAMMGWDLNIQSFANNLVLLLICTKCNQRVFLNSTDHKPVEKNDAFGVSPSTNILLSSSKVLTPCKFPPQAIGGASEGLSQNQEDLHDEEEGFDLVKEHKSWCCNAQKFGSETYVDYFINMMIASERSIGNRGEFKDDVEMHWEFNSEPILNSASNGESRKRSFDVNEGLEKLNKLRKLYLIDE